MLDDLKRQVLEANWQLKEWGLVVLTWGNVSGCDRDRGLVVIKPSGVDYAVMKSEDLVVVSLEGEIIEGKRRPSADTPTHLALYRAFNTINGIAHTHSQFATTFAQACRPIECLGTTHADHFKGMIPVTRFLTAAEVSQNYELATGQLIVETFKGRDPSTMPAVLVAGHGAFTWGKSPREAAQNSLILEQVAQLAYQTLLLNPAVAPLPEHILRKHFLRKHGQGAYYGQNNPSKE